MCKKKPRNHGEGVFLYHNFYRFQGTLGVVEKNPPVSYMRDNFFPFFLVYFFPCFFGQFQGTRCDLKKKHYLFLKGGCFFFVFFGLFFVSIFNAGYALKMEVRGSKKHAVQIVMVGGFFRTFFVNLGVVEKKPTPDLQAGFGGC